MAASQELLDAFKELVSNASQRGLLVTICSERLTPQQVLSAKGSFESDLTQLNGLLTPTEAVYIILRRYEGSIKPPFVAVTYIPDSASVKQKTLFASTRNTLLRELGTDRFNESIFATLESELTAEGFKRHDAHGAKYCLLLLSVQAHIDISCPQACPIDRRGTPSQGSSRS